MVGRGGWLRLPEELLRARDRRPRAREPARTAASSSRPPATARVRGAREQPAPRRRADGRGRARGARRDEGRGTAGSAHAVRRPRPDDPGRDDDRRHRPFGLGQDDAARLLAGLTRRTRARSSRSARRSARSTGRARRVPPRAPRASSASRGARPFLTARENVELALGDTRASTATARATALESVGLGERLRPARLRGSRPASASASPSHARSRRGRRSSSPTSRPRGSTRRTRCAVGGLLRRAPRSTAPRSSARRTTRCSTEQADRELSLVGEPLA